MSATIANGRFYCHICQVNLNSEANFALHEFEDKHCEKLLKVSKNKQIKAKPIITPVAWVKAPEPPAPNYDEIPTVNPSLYGYFNAQTFGPKEFNTEYDPYLQKLAENPNKPPPPPPPVIPTDFACGKKKKKRFCEICEMSLRTVPEFQAHMTSASHIYRLKTLGMGVSAHFVKASADLHTTNMLENTEDTQSTSSTQEFSCDICSLVLNSRSQYDAHLSGKTHQDKVNKKKHPLKFITCYTCNVQLAGICVFNDHKAGRKHRNKCMNLIRNGYAIPPEERPLGFVSRECSDLPKYPELYVKEMAEKLAQVTPEEPPVPELEMVTTIKINTELPEQDLMPPPPPPPPKPHINLSTGLYHCTQCVKRFTTASNMDLHLRSIHPNLKTTVLLPINTEPAVPLLQPEETVQPEKDFQCTICDITFRDLPQCNAHFGLEEHALKVWELKMSGVSTREIIDKILTDRKFTKAVNGKYVCGICNVRLNNSNENQRHSESVVHLASEKAFVRDWKIKLLESVQRDEDGTFCCKQCNESWPTLLQFNVHVTSNAHLGPKNQERKQRIIASFLRSTTRNPGVRTKVTGQAVDTSTGSVERVPNFEQLEPRIDQDKNVNIGLEMPSKELMAKRMRPPLPPPPPPLMGRPRARFAPYPMPFYYNQQSRPGQWAPRPFGPPRFQQQIPDGPWQQRPRFTRFNGRPHWQGDRNSHPY